MFKIYINIYMEKYSLNIDTKTLQKKISYIYNYNNDYNFLDNLQLENYYIYYDILNNFEEFKLINIYNYISQRINKINYNNEFVDLNFKENMNSIKLNEYLNNYINNDLVKSIIIMNSIQQYYFPVK